MRTTAILIGALAALGPLAAIARPAAAPPPGSKYVAMGSSFAAGPGITVSADDPPNRCARSRDNYAHQLARRRALKLTDVTCSGATTHNLLGPWNELKPQLDAVDADTRLVTITIGGNDVGLTAARFAAACRTRGGPEPCRPEPPTPTDQAWAGLEARLGRIAAEVHRRAPGARLVFVDYASLLPPRGTCPALSLTAAQAGANREIDRRVLASIARAARASGSGLLAASTLTAGHDVCSAAPWINGASAPPGGAAFHPRLQTHTAIAEALDRQIWR